MTMIGAKFVAIWFISMMAGAEFVEGNSRATFEAGRRSFHQIDSSENGSGVEKEWADANLWCKGSCRGPPQPDSPCGDRPLAGDKKGESCRLTDDYMLEPNRVHKFVEMQTGILHAKTAKFRAECMSGVKRLASHVCARRTQHMVDAMSFISKARSQLGEEKGFAQTEQVLMDSVATMGSGHSESLQQLIALGKGETCQERPMVCAKNMMEVMQDLVRGTKEERAAAKAAIADGTALDLTKEDSDREEQAGEEVSVDEVMDEARSAEVDLHVEQAIASIWEDGEVDDASSLIEVENSAPAWQDTTVHALAWALMATLVILVVFWAAWEAVGLIITWAIMVLVGCGIYSVAFSKGYQRALPVQRSLAEIEPQKTRTVRRADSADSLIQVESGAESHALLSVEENEFPYRTFGKCIIKVFVFPFTMFYKGGRFVYRKVQELRAEK